MGSDQPPSGQKPNPTAQGRPQQRQAAPGQIKPLPPRPKAPGSSPGDLAMMPFVFLSFVFGLVNMLAVPVIYVYEILENNKKDQWPAWSGLDVLNYLFFEKLPLFFREGKLFKMEILHAGERAVPIQLINLHIPALTGFVNQVVVGYLDMAAAFVCFLQGVVFMSLAVRISIRVLDRPKTPAK